MRLKTSLWKLDEDVKDLIEESMWGPMQALFSLPLAMHKIVFRYLYKVNESKKYL